MFCVCFSTGLSIKYLEACGHVPKQTLTTLPVVEGPVKIKRVPPVEFVESNYGMNHFDYDKSQLLPEARKILRKNAELIKKNLQKHLDFKLLIEGHCDERGTSEYNLALGERRALVHCPS